MVGGQKPASISTRRIPCKVNARSVAVELGDRLVHCGERCLPTLQLPARRVVSVALREYHKGRETFGMVAYCPCQATLCFANPIVSVLTTAVKGKDYRPLR